MSRSVRYVQRGIVGRHRLNFNWPGVITSAQAVVHITAGEVRPGPRTRVGRVNQDFIYHLGDILFGFGPFTMEPDVWVSNICPHENSHFGGELGGVEFVLHVNWLWPIDVAITITVEDSTPVEILN